MISKEAVLDALTGVRDPELDEPVTTLGFVSDVEIFDEAVRVWLRLPTYFCAPNFSYLMVEDSREAVLSLPGVQSAEVMLDGHHASGEINSGVEDERGFDSSFTGETNGEALDGVRATFRRKAFVRRQEILCRVLMSDGASPQDLANMTLADVPDSPEFDVYRERRIELGIDVSEGAPLIVDPDGRRVPEDAVVEHLKFARLTRVSVEGNAAHCLGLLAARYGTPEGTPEMEEARL